MKKIWPVHNQQGDVERYPPPFFENLKKCPYFRGYPGEKLSPEISPTGPYFHVL